MTNRKKFNVIGFGSLVDFIGSIDAWPEAGTKNSFNGFNVFDGGHTGTALTAVSRLGGNAAFIGRLGTSAMAERAALTLSIEKIDSSCLLRDQVSEPIIAFVLSAAKEGERNIFFQKENLSFPFPEEIPDPLWYEKSDQF